MMTPFAVRPSYRKAVMSKSARGSAADAIGVITPGCRVVGLNKGQFSLIDLIAAVLDQVGAADVMVSTWTPGSSEIDTVLAMLRSHRINTFRLLVDRSFVTRHPAEVRLVQRLGADAIRQTRTHAKFALIAAGDYRITIRTSANFNTNSRLEQFDLDDDAEIYEFFAGAVDTLFRVVPPGTNVSPRAITNGFHSVIRDSDGTGDFDFDFDWGEVSEA